MSLVEAEKTYNFWRKRQNRKTAKRLNGKAKAKPKPKTETENRNRIEDEIPVTPLPHPLFAKSPEINQIQSDDIKNLV
jgi:hypothetical protein